MTVMNMNLEQADKGLSTGSNAVIGSDETSTGSINEGYDSVDVKKFYISNQNTNGAGSNDNTNNTVIMSDEKLHNAMDSLQIVLVEELQHPPHTIMCRRDSLQNEIEEVDNKKAVMTENVLPGGMQPVIEHMNCKAMKLLSTKVPTIKGKSPSLLPKLKPHVDISINQSTSKHVIKTISNTDDGIHLKEEKINFFGIPVTTNHKKRTQVKPFNFQTRTKETQLLQKSCTASTRPWKSAFLSNNETTKMLNGRKLSQDNTKINGTNKISGNAIVAGKKEKTVNEMRASKLENDSRRNITLRKSKPEIPNSVTKMNKENHNSNTIIGSRDIKSKCTVVDAKTHADRRHQFRAKMKKREMEIEEMRAHVEQKRRDKETF